MEIPNKIRLVIYNMEIDLKNPLNVNYSIYNPDYG
jgi:hypothetical protein